VRTQDIVLGLDCMPLAHPRNLPDRGVVLAIDV
jgi:hypothetical protein